MRGIFEVKFIGKEDGGQLRQYVGFEKRYLNLIKKYFNGNKILEIGCGRGTLLELLDKEGYNVIGIDVNKKAIDAIRKKKLKAYQYDLNKGIPEKADIIVATDVIEHIYKLDKLLEDIRKKSKYFLCTVPNEFNWVARIRFLVGKGLVEHSPFNHCHVYPIEEWDRIINKYFKVLHSEYLPLRIPYGIFWQLSQKGFGKVKVYICKSR
ncbi:hypothetical protein DRN74_02210 [Candidatus Micrarchaeota archaeon]|nr:MAG: hypothetical protein DRN74_02210 [Candidatus Micrarchaeota archaeon]